VIHYCAQIGQQLLSVDRGCESARFVGPAASRENKRIISAAFVSELIQIFP
jgi:hypothetical protein